MLFQGLWPQDIAKDLTIEIENPDESWCTVFDGPLGTSLADPGGRFQVNFPPAVIRAVRLIQQGNDVVFDWSVAELQLFAPGGGSETAGTTVNFRGMNGL